MINEEKALRGTYKGYDYVARQWRKEIMRMINGYVRVPKDHPLYKPVNKTLVSYFKGKRRTRKDYDAAQDIDVHGGFTFGRKVKKGEDPWKIAGYWLGWDYGHAGDCFYDHENPAFLKLQQDNPGLFQHHPEFSEDRHWTLEEAEWDCKKVIDQLIAMEGGEINGQDQAV